ncbi:MAG: hypothetical protein HY289_14880 [Planctomycetes bacterium]|nr:hypothetical protein [Planctomycetota bacterium]
MRIPRSSVRIGHEADFAAVGWVKNDRGQVSNIHLGETLTANESGFKDIMAIFSHLCKDYFAHFSRQRPEATIETPRLLNGIGSSYKIMGTKSSSLMILCP